MIITVVKFLPPAPPPVQPSNGGPSPASYTYENTPHVTLPQAPRVVFAAKPGKESHSRIKVEYFALALCNY